MSVIAWDGTRVAADRGALSGDVRSTCPKIELIDGRVFGGTGGAEAYLLVRNWYLDGADPAKWPEIQKTDDWSRLLIFEKGGVTEYERWPVAQKVEDPYFAWGSGREVALGVLYVGGSVEQAVEAACYHLSGCSRGFSVFVPER